jgi:hypothetical protein
MHNNNGSCLGCDAVFKRYPGFNVRLWDWFRGFQSRHPEAHISCAGRGKQDQEALFIRGATRAHYGESSHNYNCAIDIFEQGGILANIYEDTWFKQVLSPEIDRSFITWYGEKGAPFFELPHCEVTRWRSMLTSGEIKLVE